MLFVDESSNPWGSGARVILESLDDFQVELSVKFEFITSNNQVEYKALIVGLNLAKDMGAKCIMICNNCQVMTSLVGGSCQAKDHILRKYLQKVLSLQKESDQYEMKCIPREQNAKADILSKLASTELGWNNRNLLQETLRSSSIPLNPQVAQVEEASSWMTPIIRY